MKRYDRRHIPHDVNIIISKLCEVDRKVDKNALIDTFILEYKNGRGKDFVLNLRDITNKIARGELITE